MEGGKAGGAKRSCVFCGGESAVEGDDVRGMENNREEEGWMGGGRDGASERESEREGGRKGGGNDEKEREGEREASPCRE